MEAFEHERKTREERTIDQRASTRRNLKSWKMETAPQEGLKESSRSEVMNNDELEIFTSEILPPSVKTRPPRVEVEGDDDEILDHKAAVMKMLRDANDQQEKNKPQVELRLNKNREMWRKRKRTSPQRDPIEVTGCKEAAVIEMLKKVKKEGETKNKLEKKRIPGELSLIEKRNR